MVEVCEVDEDVEVCGDEGEDRLPYFIFRPLLLSLFKTCTDCLDCVNDRLLRTYEPCCEKACLLMFCPGQTQRDMLGYRSWLQT